MGIFDSENVYATVKSAVKPFKECPVDEFRMFQDQLEAKKMQQVQEHNDRLMAANNARLEEQRIRDIANRPVLLENAKRIAMNKVVNETPEYLLSEAFAEVYLKALPHEHMYVMDNYNAFHKMAHMYIRKIGGMKQLAEQARVTGSPFLKGLYRIVDEASKEIIKDRNKKAVKALSEEEVREMVTAKPSDEERAKLIKKIDTLGADELADLVSQKVVDVVNDERRKEKDAVELQTIMHNELNDDTLANDSISAGSEDLDDKTEMNEDEEGKDFEDINKKDANRKALKEAMTKWDPIHEDFLHETRRSQTSYFQALLKNITEGMIMQAVGSVNKRDPKEVINNPLNLNIFESYLMEGRPARKGPEPTPVHENTTIPEIDKERVYCEALAQYALIETAHTMRLVNITPVDVARQSNFLATEYIK